MAILSLFFPHPLSLLFLLAQVFCLFLTAGFFLKDSWKLFYKYRFKKKSCFSVKNNNPEMKANLNPSSTDSPSGADIQEGEGRNTDAPE